jgi:hypothetical protein
MFDAVPTSVAFVSKSEAESPQCLLEVVCVVDEKRHVRDLLSLAEFTKRQHSELRRSRLKQPKVAELIRVGIDHYEQPVTLSTDANHRLVNPDPVRVNVAVGL